MKIGLIVAMAKEYEALERAGVRGMVKSGVGKADAARGTTELILTQHPDCIINSGCAGGIAPGINVLDIVIGSSTAYHDVWCGDGYLPGEIMGQPRIFNADPALVKAALAVQSKTNINVGF